MLQIKQHLLLNSSYNVPITSCEGVTRDPTTLEYMLVIWKMEKDLRTFIKKRYLPLMWKDVNYLFLCITSTVNSLHKGDLVHKDLHPGNILQYHTNTWYISDFGICGPANQSRSSIYGNLPYMAPEVIRGAQYSTAADIYSVGMLLLDTLHSWNKKMTSIWHWTFVMVSDHQLPTSFQINIKNSCNNAGMQIFPSVQMHNSL